MALCPTITFLVLGNSAPRAVHGPGQEVPGLSVKEGKNEQSALPVPEDGAGPEGLSALSLPVTGTEDCPITAAAGESGTGLVPQRYVARLSPYCLLLWLAGVAALSVRLMMSFLGVRMLLYGRQPTAPGLRERAAGLAGRLGLRRIPGVFLSARLREAVVVGLWKPVVLLPLSWISDMPPEALEAVLAHELAHIRRWDLWVSLGQRLVERCCSTIRPSGGCRTGSAWSGSCVPTSWRSPRPASG